MIDDEFGQRLRMAFNAPRELPVHQLFNEWWSHVPPEVANSYVALLLTDGTFRTFIDEGRYGAPLDLDALAGLAIGSLGHSYREWIVDNGLAAAIATDYRTFHDRLEQSGRLDGMPAELRFAILRGFQVHDFLHVLTGYDATSRGELALQAFSLAQFPFPYFGIWMSVVTTRMTFHDPRLITMTMDSITDGWQYGKATANLMVQPWEDMLNLEALARIRADRNGSWISSEGFDIWVDPSSESLDKVERRQAISWLVWDLHLGHDPLPAAAGYLDPIDDDVRSRIAELSIRDNVIAGHDFYPTSIQTVDGTAPQRTVAERIDLGMTALRAWHDRYRQPFWISETSNLSLPIEDQIPWLNQLVTGLDDLAHEGLPVRGVCWYSRGDQYDWQTGLARPTGAVTEVGLFDTHRIARPVAAQYQQHLAGHAARNSGGSHAH